MATSEEANESLLSLLKTIFVGAREIGVSERLEFYSILGDIAEAMCENVLFKSQAKALADQWAEHVAEIEANGEGT
jgi:hypothetical protein